MKLYIKQKVFSWADRFRIYDEQENDKYYVEGEILTVGKKLHLYSHSGNELAFIHEKVFSLLRRYFINRNGVDEAEVIKEITFFHQEYTVEGFGWTVTGDFINHEYEICSNNEVIATVSKQWLTWGDTYEIDITDKADEIIVLCVVLIIDSVNDHNNNGIGVSINL